MWVKLLLRLVEEISKLPSFNITKKRKKYFQLAVDFWYITVIDFCIQIRYLHRRLIKIETNTIPKNLYRWYHVIGFQQVKLLDLRNKSHFKSISHKKQSVSMNVLIDSINKRSGSVTTYWRISRSSLLLVIETKLSCWIAKCQTWRTIRAWNNERWSCDVYVPIFVRRDIHKELMTYPKRL